MTAHPAVERPMELLAPAGDGEALRAAVQNGADAVYLGTGAFNARRHAGNFEGDALPAAVRYCHARGVKVHVTLNTLVRQDEMGALEDAVDAVVRSGADAVIVQDLGVARVLRRMAPTLPLHGSTQMAVHNRQGAAALRRMGFHRAVLAREMTFEEMAECAAEGIEIETFIHGALCVACSGQCLMSAMVGGRSGNRGLCAQPCRLPWRLDGAEGHLLSTRDLCAIDDLARLRAAGVKSLKIEGRLKRAEYVAVTVAAYRQALDALDAGEPFDSKGPRQELIQMFNRGGFTRGYGPGVAEADLMFPERPNHMGLRVGRCIRDGEWVLDANVEKTDVLAMRRLGSADVPLRLEGSRDQRVKCRPARRGDELFRLVSHAQMRRARESFEGEHRQIPLTATAILRVGEPARVTVSDGLHRARATGSVVQPATGRALDQARVIAQLKKTGGTAYVMQEVRLEADADAFCPVSVLNGLRRDALSALEEMRTAVNRIAAEPPCDACDCEDEGEENAAPPLLLAQSADVPQLIEALRCGADVAVYAPRDLRLEYLERCGLSELKGRLALALPAVMPAEALEGLNRWAHSHADRFEATWLSNIGQMDLSWPGKRMGDFLLNIANDRAADALRQWGVDGFTPSVELTAEQIDGMKGQKDLIVWGRIPLMHLRHCPLRAVGGMPGRHADCRHCDLCKPSERLEGRSMIDRRGAAFPMVRLAMPGGCVVQILNSVPLMPLKRASKMPRGRSWRLLLQRGEPTRAIVKVYRAALDGEDFRALPEWGALEGMDTTSGHYFRGVE